MISALVAAGANDVASDEAAVMVMQIIDRIEVVYMSKFWGDFDLVFTANDPHHQITPPDIRTQRLTTGQTSGK